MDDPTPGTDERLKNKNLLDELTTPDELAGIFNLTIACMKHMLNQGKYSYSSTVEEVTENYLIKSDPVKVFTDRYTESSEGHIPVQEMYDCFIRWCEYKYIKALTAQRFTKRLKSLGFSQNRPYDYCGSRIYAWVNVSLTDDFERDIPQLSKLPKQKSINDEYTNEHPNKTYFWQDFGKELDENFHILGDNSGSYNISELGPT